MPTKSSRRTFIKTASLAGAAVAAAQFTALSYGKIIGSNDNVRMGVIGFNGRGNAHIDAWRSIDGVDLVALCDADENVLERGYARVMKGATDEPRPGNKQLKNPPRISKYSDLRKLLDSKEIDAVSTATPNHWHSLITIWGCQASKDVYVEKPVSHDVWEGRQAVAAARKYGRIVQAGTQYRSSTGIRDAIDWMKQGHLGKVKVGRAVVFNRRGSIGKVDAAPPVPPGVDLDLWCGPSPLQPPHREHFHYDWHWFWQTGNGEIGNNAIHEIDIVRWAMGKNELSSSVISVGGRFGYKDDGQTPNTQFAIHHFGDAIMVMEIRGLPSKPGSPKQDTYKGEDVGWVIECENGYLAGPTAYDNKGTVIQKFDPDGEAKKQCQQIHFTNFISAVRSRRSGELHADIEQGHLSTALCHTPNISYLLGRESDPDAINAAMKSDPLALDACERFREHLAINEVNIALEKATLGMPLKMDPRAQQFIDNPKANEMLKRKYRPPFVVPDEV